MKTLISTLFILSIFTIFLGCDSTTSSNNEKEEIQVVDYLRESNWMFDVFDRSWTSLNCYKYYGAVDSIKVTGDFPANCAYFGVDGICRSDKLGDFDSIKVTYKSNYPFKIVCATSDDKHGWEGRVTASECGVFSEFTITKDNFQKTWGNAEILIDECDIIAFTNEDVIAINEGDTLKAIFKEVNLYRTVISE